MPKIDANNFLEKVLKEFELGKSLKHQNIGRFLTIGAFLVFEFLIPVKNYHYHTEGSDLYIFLEYAGGGTLKSKIRKLKQKGQTMDENQVRIFTKQILQGLEYVHCVKGIFHRDIKPENILLTLSETIKISDFGESKFVNLSGMTQVGTPAYMAPEIILVTPIPPLVLFF
jgi:serine/threonine protein kinase